MSWPPRTNSIDLSGTWQVCRDDPARMSAPGWWRAPADTIKWSPISIPSAWQQVLGDAHHGVAWFRGVVDIPEEFHRGHTQGRRFWLRFEAAATAVTTWVNGVEVGRHVGDFIPFQFDVTEALGEGATLELVLRMDEIHAAPPDREGDLQNGHLTKGYHDVVSLQHGGLWQPVHLAHTGAAVARPDGVAIRPDAAAGVVTVKVECEPGADSGSYSVELMDPVGRPLATGGASLDDSCRMRVDDPALWSPDRPALYRAIVKLHDSRGTSETHDLRFGFRSFRADGLTTRLNGAPIMIRGVLDWGHEPKHIAPMPAPDEVRARFKRLRAMGFNCVCLCMWYPPRHYYDIADETGMLLWQEHPVWQPPMRDADLEEYRRLYDAFLRRDRIHPSLAVVSATCEHPAFHPELADWWWIRARAELPDTLLQVQTAFFRWADPERTDLHDEHTYDNSNRWATYVDDVRAHLETLPEKPFVMGETILFTSWPDVEAIRGAIGDARPWWLPRCFEHMLELESAWRHTYGESIIDRFRRQGDRFHLLGRKFQVEQFRRHAGHAGLVMNHLRDVPPCQCGFMDDLDRWRFSPEDVRGWLGDAALLLWTPQHRRGFASAEVQPLSCELALSNFAGRAFADDVSITVSHDGRSPHQQTMHIDCEQGRVRAEALRLDLPVGDSPQRSTVEASIDGGPANSWDLWTFPDVWHEARTGIHRLDAPPFTDADGAPDDVERGYSRGYGLPVRHCQCALPDPSRLVPRLPPWDATHPASRDMTVLLTHRLTDAALDWILDGGRAILFASKAPGGLGTRYEWLFGAVPLVLEEGPLREGDGEWIVDLLGYDLVRRYCRVIPGETLGISDQIDPLIRLIYTHDQTRVKLFDLLSHARLGKGHLIISSLDHSDAPGRFLLERLIAYAAGEHVTARRELDAELLRSLTFEHAMTNHSAR